MPADPFLPGNIGDPYGRRLRDIEEWIRAQNGKSQGAVPGPIRPLDSDLDVQFLVNTSITTSLVTQITKVFTKPPWATIALVECQFALQLSNISGASLVMVGNAQITSPGATSATAATSGNYSATVPNNATVMMTVPHGRKLTAVTSDVTVICQADISAGTNLTNILQLTSRVIWMA